MSDTLQPAKKSYFFGKGYSELKATIDGAWEKNYERIKGNYANMSFTSFDTRFAVSIWRTFEMASILICGSIITAVLSLIHILILATVMAFIYSCFSILWLTDRIYLWKNKIFVACPHCKEHSLLPTYICPSCGAEHTMLVPGVYGIWKRTCNCGSKLPTNFLNGRSKLGAICSHCHEPLYASESRPVCIPVIGGSSSGKSAFINAFTNEFIGKVIDANNFEVEFYDQEEKHFLRMKTDFEIGTVTKTARVDGTEGISDFSFFLKHKNFSPDRLIHLYDVAGEVFQDFREDEVQRHFEYCHGAVMILDPLTIPAVFESCKDKISDIDRDSRSSLSPSECIDAFLRKMQEVSNLSASDVLKLPIAIVITKSDIGNLQGDLSESVVRYVQVEEEKPKNYVDAMDETCRRFLQKYGADDFLGKLETEFRKYKIFACSAIGHELNNSASKRPYKPSGVLLPMNWLISQIDGNGIGKYWKEE